MRMSDPTSRAAGPARTAERSQGFRLAAGATRPGTAVDEQTLRVGGRTGKPGTRASAGAVASALPRLAPPGRKVRVPHLLVGSLLVVVCATTFFLASMQASGRAPVLALARNVSAGHVLTAGDVRVVQVAAGADVATIGSANSSTVIGGVMAAPRSAGQLLTPADVGVSKFPPPGKAVAAVPLKAGQFPPGLSAGTKVAALVAPSRTDTGSPAGASASWLPGLVVSVDGGDVDGGQTVVSLLMSENDAASLGTAVVSGTGNAGGSVSLLLLSPGSSAEGR
jgi:hypothetical protein